jgi:hypothetical protein
MIDEQLPQVLETIANGKEAKVADVVFAQDHRLQSVEGLDGLYVLIADFAVRQVDFLCMCVDDEIFDGCSLGPTVIIVDALHHYFQLIELVLNQRRGTFSSLLLFLNRSFCSLIY